MKENSSNDRKHETQSRQLYIYIYIYICREEENLVFCFGAQFNSTLNFTQSG